MNCEGCGNQFDCGDSHLTDVLGLNWHQECFFADDANRFKELASPINNFTGDYFARGMCWKRGDCVLVATHEGECEPKYYQPRCAYLFPAGDRCALSEGHGMHHTREEN